MRSVAQCECWFNCCFSSNWIKKGKTENIKQSNINYSHICVLVCVAAVVLKWRACAHVCALHIETLWYIKKLTDFHCSIYISFTIKALCENIIQRTKWQLRYTRISISCINLKLPNYENESIPIPTRLWI